METVYEYVNLDLELSNYQKDSATKQETFRVHVVRLRDCTPMTSDQAVPVTFSAKQRESITLLKEGGLNKEGMIERGEILGNILLPPGTVVREIYEECLNSLTDGQRLRIRLTLGHYALSDLPWEYAYILPPNTPDTQKDLNGFLVRNKRISLVRHPAIGKKEINMEPVDRKAIRMVVITASPKNDDNYSELRLDNEYTNIQTSLKDMPPGIPSVVPELHPDATRDALQEALMLPAHIFHFAGHGDFKGDFGGCTESISGQGYIIVINSVGKGEIMSAADLAGFLCGSRVRLAILTACKTGATDQMNAWTGVAPALIQAGIPAVVGMQFEIDDDNAIAFGSKFYLALARGLSIDAAVTEGRLAIRTDNNERDWGVPVLYLQSSKGVLFPKIDSTTAANKGILALKYIPEAYMPVCQSQAAITTTSAQIDKLGFYKKIHDYLHKIETECLKPLRDESMHDLLPYYKNIYQSACDIIRENIRGKATPELIVLNYQLDQVSEAFKAVGEISAVAGKVVGQLEMLLSGTPQALNKKMADAAAELDLGLIVKLMNDVKTKLMSNAPGIDATLLLQGIDGLKDLQDELKNRVLEHTQLQHLDSELRTACVAITEARSMADAWEVIKRVHSWIKPFSEEVRAMNDDLAPVEQQIETAMTERNEPFARKLLNFYFTIVTEAFPRVDSKLKEFCITKLTLNQSLQAIQEIR
jgi:hypothetical protein